MVKKTCSSLQKFELEFCSLFLVPLWECNVIAYWFHCAIWSPSYRNTNHRRLLLFQPSGTEKRKKKETWMGGVGLSCPCCNRAALCLFVLAISSVHIYLVLHGGLTVQCLYPVGLIHMGLRDRTILNPMRRWWMRMWLSSTEGPWDGPNS